MKVLLYGNAPTAPTGYGVQIAMLADRLARDGHTVAVACTYGHDCGMGKWTTPSGDTIRLYFRGFEANASNDVIHGHAEHFFEGDPKGGWIIPLMDVWSLVNPRLADLQVAAWAPVDHFPAPASVLKFFHMSGAECIAMSRFGERQFRDAGLDPHYVPLAVDTQAYRPTFTVPINGEDVDARRLYNVPEGAFVVGMVAMNKGWAWDRKGWNEAFRAFAVFWQQHQNAVLLVHSERFGAAEGINLVELATHAGIPEHALIWSDQYAYRVGFPANMMAALYSSMDVLLAPSHGEGFCVPLIEAQACGTPVIATDFSAQPELVTPDHGWLVTGQPEWDPAQLASAVVPFIADVVAKLNEAYETLDDPDVAQRYAKACREFALGYDADVVYDRYWRPLLERLEPSPPSADKPRMERVDVLVPAVRRENRARLLDSFNATNDGTARLILGEELASRAPVKTFAENVNGLLGRSDADWIFVAGDDVEFTPGWIAEARKLSDRYDVIGSNDSEPGRIRNQAVANGSHADHMFVRRSYVDDEGASLDGPGKVFSEAYRHWFSDKELIQLAKARGVWSPCLDSRVIHHHPGYDGNETARQMSPTYMAAVAAADDDRRTFMGRVGLIEAQRSR